MMAVRWGKYLANPVKHLGQALLSVEESNDHYCFYFYLGSSIIKIKPLLWVSKLA